jgi:hypothetical protein
VLTATAVAFTGYLAVLKGVLSDGKGRVLHNWGDVHFRVSVIDVKEVDSVDLSTDLQVCLAISTEELVHGLPFASNNGLKDSVVGVDVK